MPQPYTTTITDREFGQLRDLIHAHTGIALSEHKRALVCSRLAKRLRHYNLACYADYYELLTQADPDGRELMEMINAITTNKTDFFRESHHFQFLSEQVFPALKQSRQRRLRIWSAAASSGEEAYTLAITVSEVFPAPNDWDIKILATDIDTNVLERAARGVYSQHQVRMISKPLLQRYFLKGAGAHEDEVMVKPVLKSLIRFARLNLIDEPWPMQGPFDAILCRNVFIYFDKPTQQRLFARFAKLLRKDGYLMLGHAEFIQGHESLFSIVGHSIYRRRGN
ncbi:MAG: hypothetical protein A2V92_03420 [Candidatus Muproteobacteria bacterium RBG_16_65_31]|uniref:Chemotaxis protein methyltransferase n=1 Tax=Candidatus Muproteobacteria bacterium RBG_16_65_31 TaxID=1817759 RepID=A0A1F6TH19_9PROT|nr:MAG: hypothetical protein A2V92_03420 [Candidatus Muproteobacteria bacterium RBG_16_65_31]